MPRILLIEPWASEAGASPFAEQGDAAMPVALDPGTEIVRRPTRLATASVGSAPEALLLDLAVYDAGLGAEADGFDAVYVHHAADPGVAALRSALSVPVLGAGRPAMLYALTLGSRFSVLASDPAMATRLGKAIHDGGLKVACASVRALDGGDPRGDAALEGARLSVETDGADVIVLGSTRMVDVAAALSERLGVPVVDPGPVGLALLESFLALRLRHSRRAHPEPMVRKDALVRALVDAVAEPRARDA
jgi:allantoin racemase